MEGATPTEQKKKAEVLKELKQLKLKIQNLEREKSSQFYSHRSDNQREYTALHDIEMKAEAGRKAEKAHLQQQLTKISTMVKKFQRELKNVQPTPEFVEKLKVIMEEIEGHISDYKTRQREAYEDMLREERLTSQEVAALDKRFDSWAATLGSEVTSRSSPGGALSQRDTPRDLPPQVKAFERFVAASGGPRGGWDDYDHSTFLKFRNRHKGKLTFLRECAASLPTRTDVEIRGHEEWYQQYLSLNDAKREAIARWKERKDVEKDQLLTHADREDHQAAETRRQQDEVRQREIQAERDVQRAELSRWKVEKELERAQQEETQLREELRRAEGHETQRHKQLERRDLVEQYKRTKQEQEAEDERRRRWELQVQTEERQRQASARISRYRDKDLAVVKQKRAAEEAEKSAAAERKDRVAKSLRQSATAHIQRDPSRLLQPTAGWRERQKADKQAGGQALHMPHRAVPTWRQGLQ